ncbi:hypothetical protein [Mycobacterium sp. SMC-4]|uniref:hypothetical protein n=1 Tax=Mycobacterium sp. SMC-4 TaxID=2857059 RepID=UPI003D01D524
MTTEVTGVERTTVRVPRSLRCRAYRCGNPIETAGMCAAHRLGLALTAAISDALFAFLRRAPIAAEYGQADAIRQAGECFARGLALLVGTQFGAQMAWNCAPITYTAGRWRVRFWWVVTDETDFCGPIDFAEPGMDGDDETDESDEAGEGDNADEANDDSENKGTDERIGDA